MLLSLATHHNKKIAFLFGYLFLLSGLCTVVYGSNNLPVRYNVFKEKGYLGLTVDPTGYLPFKQSNGIEKKKKEDTRTGTPVNNLDERKPGQRNNKARTDIGGPNQPEMSAFKPVGADNMVDPFTGDFSYNIPLLDVGGYPVNIFYNSGITMDQEASWVGLGWNINPGTINRNMRGLPDDFNGSEKITKTEYTKADRTWGVNVGGRFELFGGALGLGIDGGIFYNNMRGLGLEAGISPSLSIGGKSGDDKTASLTIGWKLSANSQSGGSSTFNISLSDNNKKGLDGSLNASIGVHSRQGLQALHINGEFQNMNGQGKNQYSIAKGDFQYNPTIGTSINFAYPSFLPSMRSKTISENYDIDLGFGPAGMGAFPHARLGGYYTQRRIRDEDVVTIQPAYGMLYLKKSEEKNNALMDFNRLNDGVYTPGTPAISVPVYTYDVYSITGEGTGGSFRAYRGDLGYMKDGFVDNNGTSGHLGFELGPGGYGHGAINANIVLTPSSSGGWDKGNLTKPVLGFRESNADTQAVYFKNPGEKAIPNLAWQESIGGEDLVRLKMINTGLGAPSLIPSLVRYTDMLQKKDDLPISTSASIKGRDKRTQVISFLTGSEAKRVGLNKEITYVRLNEADSNQVVFGCSKANRYPLPRVDATVRRENHVSEIDVLMQDGRRYVYDIPVYNLSQTDVTFNKKGSGGGNGPNDPLVSYAHDTDNEPGENNDGKEGYVEKQVMPPYAHSYLLTGLLSPNYVDVKGDGITEDDMGDALKFNYSKAAQPLKWRTPSVAGQASLSEGLKTDKNDDKAHYVYGVREQWYLYSIESKNMVARFYVRNDRKDSRSVLNEQGDIDISNGAWRLSKISLFTKGELLKRPANPRPVKTVHFQYDYSLCMGAPGSVPGHGKLTLKSIYFTYNGNNRSKKNVYRFEYPDPSQNPAYSFRANDRWGNYKPDVNDDPANGNPGDLVNADFPYAAQNKAKADNYAKAWTMNRIILPSGAAVSVDYEADDYAYVQDRRAANMYSISGFGTSESIPSNASRLYNSSTSTNDFIYITVPRAITATTATTIKSQIQQWYLGDLGKTRQVYMKLAVNVPTDNNGSGYELIPVYAQVADFGVVPGTSGQKIWLRVNKLESGYTPMVHYSLQFLKSNLPSKAYKGYDVSEDGGLKAIVKSLGALFTSFKEVFNGGMKLFMDDQKFKYTQLSKSFIRLSDPYLNKKGGGIRVKKVVINDNWDKMTKSNPAATDGILNATYGQEYFYTKKELVDGVLTEISSGVASWEPALGAEENPHRQAIEFYNKTPKADYDYRVMEMPLAEMLYPSAMVGYSRVETRSIHRDTVKNAPGISVSEFYTTREFPTISAFTPLSEHNATDQYEAGALDKLLKTDIRTAVALSQGFKVDLNDMNGKMKKQSTYAPNNLNDPISYTENFYSMVRTGGNSFKLNHSFPVIGGPDGKVQQSVIGREVELMTDVREHKQQTITTNINFNLDVINGVVIPIPIPTTWKPLVRESNTYRSASVLKVVNHYSVLDSVVAVDKGSMVSTKNMVYDAETGDPLLTRTNNEHNQPVYSFSYPAHWAYSGMGLAYKNIDVIYKGLNFKNGRLDASANVNYNLLESGDELMVESQQGLGPIGSGPCEPFIFGKSNAKKVWAVYTGKAGSATPQWIFIDADGNPYSAANVNVRIIRSGKRNMYSAGLGSIVSLSNPVNATTGQVSFSDATNIIQTAAATYKDHWRVDDAFYVKDSTVKVTVQARIKRKIFPAVETYSVSVNYRKGSPIEYFGHTLNPSALLNRSRGFKKHTMHTDSWLRFNFTEDPVPAGAEIYRAALAFNAHVPSAGVAMPGHSTGDGKNLHPSGWSHRNATTANWENYISIQRMTSPWPSANDFNSWNNLIYDITRTKHDWTVGALISRTDQYAANNYILQNTADTRIDFTTAAKRMINDYNTPGNTNAAAIRMFRMRSVDGVNTEIGNDVDIYQCFWPKDPRQGSSALTPKMYVYYYNCGDTSTQSLANFGLPDPNDPLLNQLITCNTTTATYQFCRSKFTQRKSINPYVEGIWGNWRVDTSFVYYGDRKENTIVDGTPVDTRKGGTIVGYKSFWNFAALSTGILTRNFAASDVWTWNSTITQYNRKGYEVENKDALGRFNAGIYGYNQQLPVAVVNNSRYAESMFDGFEDYDYQSNSCTETCKPRRRVDMGNIQPYLSSEQKHSGLQSLKLNPGQSFVFSAPVVNEASLDKTYSMRVKVDSTQFTDTVVNSAGNGLSGDYIKNGFHRYQVDKTINLQMSNWQYQATTVPPAGNGNDWYYTVWTGFIQPAKTGQYSFRIMSDDRMKVQITKNGVNTIVVEDWDGGHGPRYKSGTTSITLYAGQVYGVKIDYEQMQGPNAYGILFWKNENMSNYELVPQNQLYTTAPSGNVQTFTRWCTKPDSINVRGNALTDTFSLIQNKRMLVSAWVKVGGNDCKCSTYVNNKIRISYTGGSDMPEFTPAGSIIEGWQRYEGVFDIPITATKLTIELMNTGSSSPLWFDDLRIHPFNANMKSFVYNPQSLRLMSELDENNYASFYEYDDEGTLTRVKKETIKGVKTITETRSHLQKAVQ